MTDIRKNFVYSMVLTGANYVFPLMVYPYVSRVLGVSNIGLVGFIDSIATYFILFSMMGISILGVREIARCENDRKTRSEVFADLLTLHGIVTGVALAVMTAVTLLVSELREQSQMMGVGMCKLIFNLFLVEWFYRGLEDFRYVAVRTVIIKILYVSGVFLLVRSEEDTLTYYILTMLVVVVTAVCNMLYSVRFIDYRGISLRLRRFLKPYFSLGVYMLLTSAYTTLNVVVLGFVADDREVGYYTTASKLFMILLTVYGAFVNVLQPRMTRLLGQGNDSSFRRYLRRTASLMLWLSMPVVLIGELAADQIVWIISGPGYGGAVLPIRIIMPFMPLMGISQVLVVQALTPMGDDRSVTRNAMIGALAGVVLNIVLVPWLKSVGSAIVWVASETIVLVLSYVSVRARIGRMDNKKAREGVNN